MVGFFFALPSLSYYKTLFPVPVSVPVSVPVPTFVRSVRSCSLATSSLVWLCTLFLLSFLRGISLASQTQLLRFLNVLVGILLALTDVRVRDRGRSGEVRFRRERKVLGLLSQTCSRFKGFAVTYSSST